jgi:dTDP-4-dehydrorhamnose reductase
VSDDFGPTLVTGSTGMLGRYVMDSLAGANSGEVRALTRNECDLADPGAAYEVVKGIRPAAVLHLAAETDVDLCERDPGRAGLVNHLATDAIARAANETGARLLYVSTSNVFGAEGKHIYNELDLPTPVNYYGRSKLHGEAAIRQRLPDAHLIVRAGWMIGGGPGGDHKFVGQVAKKIREKVPELRAVVDKFGSLTSARLLAEFLISALRRQITGTIHFCSSGAITRFDVAQAIAEALSFEGRLIGVRSSNFPLSAPRPQSEAIESIYATVNGADVHSWRADLATYLAEFE